MKNSKLFTSIIFVFFICIASNVSAFSYQYLKKDFFTSVHVLVASPAEHIFVPVRASGNMIKRETVATLANRYDASAAINGGFWKLDGTPAGILKIDYQWYGTPTKPRGAIGWSLDGQTVLIDRVLTNCHINDCPDYKNIEVLPISIPPQTTSQQWHEVPHIVGGTPVLINNGSIIQDFSPEQTIDSFLTKRHSRTAIGIRDNGDWVFVVVDSGLFFGLIGGITMNELALLMKELGCVKALNLDGGRSSTMVIDGTAINHPYGSIFENGKFVQAVSDAILIYPLKEK